MKHLFEYKETQLFMDEGGFVTTINNGFLFGGDCMYIQKINDFIVFYFLIERDKFDKWVRKDMIYGVTVLVRADNFLNDYTKNSEVRNIKLPDKWLSVSRDNKFNFIPNTPLQICRDMIKLIMWEEPTNLLNRVKKYKSITEQSMKNWKTLGDIIDFAEYLKVKIEKDLDTERFDL